MKLKRILSLTLALVLCLGCLSFSAQAAEPQTLEADSAAELQTAIANAKNGDTIKLTADINGYGQEDADYHVDIKDKTITLDIGSYKFNGGYIYSENDVQDGCIALDNATVTVVGTTGSISNWGGSYTFLLKNGSVLNVKSGNVVGGNSNEPFNIQNGTVNIYGGTVGGTYIANADADFESATVNIYGGNLNAGDAFGIVAGGVTCTVYEAFSRIKPLDSNIASTSYLTDLGGEETYRYWVSPKPVKTEITNLAIDYSFKPGDSVSDILNSVTSTDNLLEVKYFYISEINTDPEIETDGWLLSENDTIKAYTPYTMLVYFGVADGYRLPHPYYEFKDLTLTVNGTQLPANEDEKWYGKQYSMLSAEYANMGSALSGDYEVFETTKKDDVDFLEYERSYFMVSNFLKMTSSTNTISLYNASMSFTEFENTVLFCNYCGAVTLAKGDTYVYAMSGDDYAIATINEYKEPVDSGTKTLAELQALAVNDNVYIMDGTDMQSLGFTADDSVEFVEKTAASAVIGTVNAYGFGGTPTYTVKSDSTAITPTIDADGKLTVATTKDTAGGIYPVTVTATLGEGETAITKKITVNVNVYAFLDLEKSETYPDSKGINQGYNLSKTGGEYKDVTKVKLTWKTEDILVDVTGGQIWDPATLKWTIPTDAKATVKNENSSVTATFDLENLSSVAVNAGVSFAVAKDSKNNDKFTAPTVSFKDNAETGDGDGKIALKTVVGADHAVDTTVDTTGKVAVTLSEIKADDFKSLSGKGTYGTYTVKLSKKTVNATVAVKEGSTAAVRENTLVLTGNGWADIITANGGNTVTLTVSGKDYACKLADVDGNLVLVNAALENISLYPAADSTTAIKSTDATATTLYIGAVVVE